MFAAIPDTFDIDVVSQIPDFVGRGYGIGIVIAAVLVRAANNSTASLVLPWELGIVVGFVTLTMCVIASLLAIHKIKRIDPTMVFR